jgi:hypothetical protein
MSTANAKTVIRFVTSLTEGIAAGLEDGKFQLNDALALLPAVVELPVAVTAAQNIDLGTCPRRTWPSWWPTPRTS